MKSFRSGDIQGAKVIKPKTRQREIKRITSNLPEVYNRYFMTMGPSNTKKEELNLNSQSKLDLKIGFSLNKTQKDSIRADAVNSSLLPPAQASQ